MAASLIYPQTAIARYRPDQWQQNVATGRGEPAFSFAGSNAGNLYVCVADEMTKRLAMWKSSDAGATWIEQDHDHQPPTSDMVQVVAAACQIGSVIHVVTTNAAIRFVVTHFDCATDTWGTTSPNGPAFVYNDGDWTNNQDGNWMPRTYLVEQGGNLVFFYPGPHPRYDYNSTVSYAYFDTASNSWSAVDQHVPRYNDIDGTSTHEKLIGAVAGANGRVHVITWGIFYVPAGTQQLVHYFHYALSSAGSWSAPQDITTDVWGANSTEPTLRDYPNSEVVTGRIISYADGAGVKIAIPFRRQLTHTVGKGEMGMAIAVSDSVPAWSFSTVSSTLPPEIGKRSYLPSGCCWVTAEQSIAVTYDRRANLESAQQNVYHDQRSAPLSPGLWAFWLDHGFVPPGQWDYLWSSWVETDRIYFSHYTGGAWTPAEVFLDASGDFLRNLMVTAITAGGPAARYRAL